MYLMITAEHCRGARAILNWSQDELASAANVGLSTIRDFEKGRHTPQLAKMLAIEDALRAADIHFVTYANGAIGVFHGPVDPDSITASDPALIQERLRALQDELLPVTNRIINGTHTPDDLELNSHLQAEIADLVDKLKESTSPRPKLQRRVFNMENRAMHYSVEYGGRTVDCILPGEIINDWHRARYRTTGDFVTAFDRNTTNILMRTQRAIDGGRPTEPYLVLNRADFPEVG